MSGASKDFPGLPVHACVTQTELQPDSSDTDIGQASNNANQTECYFARCSTVVMSAHKSRRKKKKENETPENLKIHFSKDRMKMDNEQIITNFLRVIRTCSKIRNRCYGCIHKIITCFM